MAKLTAIIANPELAKSANRSSYNYELTIAGKKVIASSHIEAITTTIKALADNKVIKIEDLETTKIAGFPLLVDVSDLKNSQEIVKLLTELKWNKRYQTKNLLAFGGSNFIVNNQWTAERVVKFLNAQINSANSTVKDPTKSWAWKNLNTVEPVKPVATKPVAKSSGK